MQRLHRSSVFFKEEMAFSEIQFLSDVPIVREKLSGVEKSIDGKLKHYKRSSSRRQLIRAFVNNQSRTNLLLKQKGKVIAAKEAISLPEGSAPKECKQENQVIMKVCSLTSCTVYYSVNVTSSCKIPQLTIEEYYGDIPKKLNSQRTQRMNELAKICTIFFL
ncbi:hypothetical protein M514_17639 [Trichuris suis]|uniref:Uncharacterized protein n=1 Tax=Trichuris suis TaxID=68888 RepID=A0A085NLE3_9BILA|nr:hypothetical protein M514_17639 [Trichuris suis]